MKCTVVIPTYNECSNIEEVVRRVLAAGPEFHTLIVDDNSPDGTGQIAEAIAQRESRVQVLHRPERLGLGLAYVQGFEMALAEGCDFVAQMDADLSHDPERLVRFLEVAISKEADFVVGSRYSRGGKIVNWPWKRRLLSWAGNRYARLLLGPEIRDYMTGFNIIRADALRRIRYGRIASAGFAFLLEFKYTCLRDGFRITHVPISFVERRNGRSKLTLRIIAEGFFRVWDLRFLREWPARERPPQVARDKA